MPGDFWFTMGVFSEEDTIFLKGRTQFADTPVIVVFDEGSIFSTTSDSNGDWEIFVSASRFGIIPGKPGKMKI